MRRWVVLLYGLLAYVVGFASLILFMLFLGDWSFSPCRIHGTGTTSQAVAVLTDVVLLIFFAVPHSLMARPWFKQKWTKLVPPVAERSTYVLVAGLTLIALCAWWRPLAGALGKIENPAIVAAVLGLQLCGWAIVVVASFTINHWELFGVRQVFFYFQGKTAPALKFTERGLYRVVRHPIQTGILIGIWSTPAMTTSHLLFAAGMTAYVLIALRLEERDLIAELGPTYEDYRRRVPMLVPIRFRNRP